MTQEYKIVKATRELISATTNQKMEIIKEEPDSVPKLFKLLFEKNTTTGAQKQPQIVRKR